MKLQRGRCRHKQQFPGLGSLGTQSKAKSRRGSVRGTDNGKMGAVCLPPVCASLQAIAGIGKGIPLQKQGTSAGTSTRDDARSLQVCPAPLNYPSAKLIGPGSRSETRAGSPCHCPLPPAHFLMPSPWGSGAVTSIWKCPSGRETAGKPWPSTTEREGHKAPPAPLGIAHSPVCSLQPQQQTPNPAQQEQG